MTNNLRRLGSQAAAVVLTLFFSAAMVAGAVGPAVDGHSIATVAALDNTLGEPSQTLV